MRINKDIGTTIFAVCSTVVGFGIVASTVKDVIDYNNSCIKNISTKIKEKDLDLIKYGQRNCTNI